SSCQGAACRSGHRPDDLHACRVRLLHGSRDGEMGQGGEVRGDQSGMITMKTLRRQLLCVPALAAALAAMPQIASPQIYPSRPVTIVVPFPAAGPADVLARILGEAMRTSLRQS